MGTLNNQIPYNQKVTHSNMRAFIKRIKRISEETNVEFYEVIQAYDYLLKEAKADTHDEQMAGFGRLWRDTNDIIKDHFENQEYYNDV